MVYNNGITNKFQIDMYSGMEENKFSLYLRVIYETSAI